MLHDRRLRPLWRALLLAIMVAVCWLAFLPKAPTLPFGQSDKVQHLGAFAVLGMVALLGAGTGRGAPGIAALAMLIFGIFIEVVQTQIPGRSGELPDLVADAFGIALGLCVVLAARRRFPEPARAA